MKVRLTGESLFEVRAVQRGGLAVHKAVDLPGWTLTHKPTGMALCHSLDRRLLLRLSKDKPVSASSNRKRATRFMRNTWLPKLAGLADIGRVY
jgi:hypothetical protein